MTAFGVCPRCHLSGQWGPSDQCCYTCQARDQEVVEGVAHQRQLIRRLLLAPQADDPQDPGRAQQPRPGAIP